MASRICWSSGGVIELIGSNFFLKGQGKKEVGGKAWVERWVYFSGLDCGIRKKNSWSREGLQGEEDFIGTIQKEKMILEERGRN